MKHVMIDIETMGNRPGAAIISIAAVRFDPETGATGAELDVHISLEDAMKYGLKCDASTIMWWLRQSDEARQKLQQPGEPIYSALFELSNFIEEDDHVWGNSARFDLGIIEHAFHAVRGEGVPWKFYTELDVRTMLWMMPEVRKYFPFKGVKHEAITDCYHQIKMVSHVRQCITAALRDSNYISNISLMKERYPGGGDE